MKTLNKPKILILDIETRPALVYTWGLHNVNIGVEQILDPGGVLCVGAKWAGAKEATVYTSWEMGQRPMLATIHALISEADAVVSYNGVSFDLPRLNGEFVLHRLAPIPPLTNIDLLKVTRKMGFLSKKLSFVGPLLSVGKKISHEGFSLWSKVMEGDAKARLKMIKYCKQDVELTEKLYDRLRPYITNHPTLGEGAPGTAGVCGSCGGKHFQSRGYRRTKFYSTQRLQCQTCGAWSTGTRKKIS